VTQVVILAVPWDERRAANARLLKAQTGGRICWDTGHNAYENFLVSMTKHRNRSAIRLEDDVTLCDNWTERIEAVLANHRREPITFFSTDPSRESHYRPDFNGAQCWYLPARLWAPVYEWVSASPRRAERGALYDVATHECFASLGEQLWQVVPSLVQHRAWVSAIDENRTLNRPSPTAPDFRSRHKYRLSVERHRIEGWAQTPDDGVLDQRPRGVPA
jgi:hypothetical protein